MRDTLEENIAQVAVGVVNNNNNSNNNNNNNNNDIFKINNNLYWAHLNSSLKLCDNYSQHKTIYNNNSNKVVKKKEKCSLQ